VICSTNIILTMLGGKCEMFTLDVRPDIIYFHSQNPFTKIAKLKAEVKENHFCFCDIYNVINK
jgi:hypothetical protein